MTHSDSLYSKLNYPYYLIQNTCFKVKCMNSENITMPATTTQNVIAHMKLQQVNRLNIYLTFANSRPLLVLFGSNTMLCL